MISLTADNSSAPSDGDRVSMEKKQPLIAAADGHNNAFFGGGSDGSYKDVIFLVLFVVHLLVLLATAASYGLVSVSNEGPRYIEVSNKDGISVSDNRSLATIVFCGLLIIMGTATVSSILWVFILSRLAHTIVNAIIYSFVVLPIISGAAICISGYYSYGVVLVGISVGLLALFLLMRPRIDFMLSNLSVAATALLEMPHTFFYTLVVLLLQASFVVVWSLAVVGTATNGANVSVFDRDGAEYSLSQCWSYEYHNNLEIGDEILSCSGSSACKACICDVDKIIHSSHACYTPRMYIRPFVLLLLSLFWTCAVLSNIVHCTIAASISSWWILPHPSELIVHEAFVRSVTTSLGSICLGSLVVAMVRMMRSMVYFLSRQAEKSSSLTGVLRTVQSFLVYVIQYLMRFLDWLVTYFNRYALCFVAIYRYDFFKASIAATNLFRNRGWTAFLNDDILDLFLFSGHLIIGAICMAVGGIYGTVMHVGHACVALLSVAGFMGGYLISMVTLSSTSSAVAAVFVCFADSPDSLEFTHPEAFHSLRAAWDRLFQRNHGESQSVKYAPGTSSKIDLAHNTANIGVEEATCDLPGPYGYGPIRPQYLELHQQENFNCADDSSVLPTMLDSVWKNAHSMMFGYRTGAPHPSNSTSANAYGCLTQRDVDEEEEEGAFTRPTISVNSSFPTVAWPQKIGESFQQRHDRYREDVQPLEQSFEDTRYKPLPIVKNAINALSDFTSTLSVSVFGSNQTTDQQLQRTERMQQALPHIRDRAIPDIPAVDSMDFRNNDSLHSVDLEESTL